MLNTLNYLRKRWTNDQLEVFNNNNNNNNNNNQEESSNSGTPKKQPNPYIWELNFWKKLNFMDIAKSSQRCHAYFTSFLHLELWYEKVYIIS